MVSFAQAADNIHAFATRAMEAGARRRRKKWPSWASVRT
jgi:hypothetical protein